MECWNTSYRFQRWIIVKHTIRGSNALVLPAIPDDSINGLPETKILGTVI